MSDRPQADNDGNCKGEMRWVLLFFRSGETVRLTPLVAVVQVVTLGLHLEDEIRIGCYGLGFAPGAEETTSVISSFKPLRVS